MIAYTLSLMVALAFLGAASAQTLSPGPCPKNITAMSDFDVEKYLGTWYEHSKYPAIWERNGKCVSAVYSEECDGNVGVNNTLTNKYTGEVLSVVGTAELVEDGKLLVSFPNSPTSSTGSNYWVLYSDYKSVAVVYSCQPISKLVHAQFAWILTRKRVPCEQTIVKAEHVMSSNGISLRDLTTTDQSGCH